MKEIIQKKTILTDKIKESAKLAVSIAEKYVSSFHPDIFGKQKLTCDAEADFFAMSEKLRKIAESIMECTAELLALENECETEARKIHDSAALASEIPDLCIEPFLRSVYEETKKDVADVGNVRHAASGFSVKLQNYIIRIG